MSLSPAAKIATTVAKAMAERGDDVGPNVTLVLLAELEASQVLLESRDQRIQELEARVVEQDLALHELPTPGLGQMIVDAPNDDPPTGSLEDF